MKLFGIHLIFIFPRCSNCLATSVRTNCGSATVLCTSPHLSNQDDSVKAMDFIGRATDYGTEYLGIPFATAARFQSPVDVALSHLPTNFSATQFGPCCPQPPAVYVPSQSEDCLNLNVFTPQNNSTAEIRSGDSGVESNLAPVLFFIHGGGGTTGCSAQSLPPLYNGTDLLSRSTTPVVVVTINYRLSVLGTLYIEGGIPDQLAIRDMLSALRWVQKYIHLFGGDSSRVLIFGESAGGNSVQQVCVIDVVVWWKICVNSQFIHFANAADPLNAAAGHHPWC